MKAVNLYEATEVLERAWREVVGAEHETDKRAREMYGVKPDMDIMLLDYNKPHSEPFPDKNNQKRAKSKLRGDVKITEIGQID